MQPDTTDAELVQRALAGEREAFAWLVRRHHESCARYARRMLGNVHDAEDVVQEAFLRAYQALDRYKERDRFRSWLFSILVNRCRSQWASRRRRRRAPESAGPEADAGGEDAGELRDLLQSALGALDPLSREALLLKYGEDLDYEQMARLTGSSVPALKMRVKRARDQVRPLLEGLLNEP